MIEKDHLGIGRLTFRQTLTRDTQLKLPLDSEDSFRTGCRNVSRLLRTPITRMISFNRRAHFLLSKDHLGEQSRQSFGTINLRRAHRPLPLSSRIRLYTKP